MKFILTHNNDDTDLLHACFPVMKQLRDHLTLNTFIERVTEQFNEGYYLLSLHDQGTVKALAGFLYKNSLSMGRHIYINDLVTDHSARKQGYASQLLDHIQQIAEQKHIQHIRLDSGLQRQQAHQFYSNYGFAKMGYVFVLSKPEPVA